MQKSQKLMDRQSSKYGGGGNQKIGVISKKGCKIPLNNSKKFKKTMVSLDIKLVRGKR